MLALVINLDFSLSTNRLTNQHWDSVTFIQLECQSVYAFLLLMRKVTSLWHPTVSLNRLYSNMGAGWVVPTVFLFLFVYQKVFCTH